jgi:sporulation protein YlmC with PRC-barrel domain
MKLPLFILTGGLVALCLPLQTQAQSAGQNSSQGMPGEPGVSSADNENPALPVQANFGPQQKWSDITEVKITNLQGETLGRIQGLALDLSNGRVVEVLVVSGQVLRLGGKTVGVPPRALIPDAQNKVYQINISAEAFADAPAFDLKKWDESTQADKVLAAYHYFGQNPYFLNPGETPGRTTAEGRPLVALGIVERMSKIVDMDVNDMNGKLLGRMGSLVLDVPNGRIVNAYINSNVLGSPLKFSTVIPPTLLTFDAKRDHLLLDVTKVEYKEEPHVMFETGPGGETTGSFEQDATTPHTDLPLVQGTSYRDINTTAQIYNSMKEANLDTYGVEVATLAGRVTLRGNVESPGTKVGVGAIAINLVRIDNVDNQIEVTQPTQGLPPAQSSN